MNPPRRGSAAKPETINKLLPRTGTLLFFLLGW
uniref:Uncharacterized protein n=1 Tax=Arundo donax TaxID=35708 RepID=A0A0A9HM45_ARUDO